MTVLITGDISVPSAPQLTLGRSLQRAGLHITFSEDVEAVSTRAWLRLVAACDAVVVVAYRRPTSLRIRQWALARAIGKPVIRWWVGSDVLFAVTDDITREKALLIDRFTSTNLAVAEHLVEELRDIGVRAQYVPSVVADDIGQVDVAEKLPSGVLTYLPTEQQSFYGAEIVEQAISQNPDFLFIVVGDEAHRLASYPNVESLGWADDMDAVWRRTGCLIRMTQHDGLPRMVLEALLRGKYVIYSRPMKGCWHATTVADVQSLLNTFRQLEECNTAGLNAVRTLLRQGAEVEFAAIIETIGALGFGRDRAHALETAIQLSVRMVARTFGERFGAFWRRQPA